MIALPVTAWPIPLPHLRWAAKAQPIAPEVERMSLEAVAAILVFLAVLGGLNYYEFHRLD